MKVTQSAAEAILEIMKKEGLDPERFSILLDQHRHGCAFEFTDEVRGLYYHFHGLNVQATQAIDVNSMIIDYVERDGKRGLVFRNSGSAE